MTTMLRAMTITNAAWREAARLRHPDIDVDHVLLALIAAGGPAAALLGRHGISLAGARRAAAQSRSAVLTDLGLDAPADPIPLPPTDLHVDAAGEVPMSARAEALLTGLPRTWSEQDLLTRCLQESTGTNVDILRRCGADVDAVLVEAEAAPRTDADEPQRTTPAADLAPRVPGTRTAAWRMTHMISAPIEIVHRAVTDADLVIRWMGFDDDSATVDGATVRHVQTKGGRTLTTVLEKQTDEPCRDGLRVVWTTTLRADGRWDGTPGTYVDLHLRAVPGGTAVEYTCGNRTFGRFARPAMWIAAMGTPIGMVHRMQYLAFVAADLQN